MNSKQIHNRNHMPALSLVDFLQSLGFQPFHLNNHRLFETFKDFNLINLVVQGDDMLIDCYDCYFKTVGGRFLAGYPMIDEGGEDVCLIFSNENNEESATYVSIVSSNQELFEIVNGMTLLSSKTIFN